MWYKLTLYLWGKSVQMESLHSYSCIHMGLYEIQNPTPLGLQIPWSLVQHSCIDEASLSQMFVLFAWEAPVFWVHCWGRVTTYGPLLAQESGKLPFTSFQTLWNNVFNIRQVKQYFMQVLLVKQKLIVKLFSFGVARLLSWNVFLFYFLLYGIDAKHHKASGPATIKPVLFLSEFRTKLELTFSKRKESTLWISSRLQWIFPALSVMGSK